jgi:3-hydroxybutyryl-CoA dehydrogenase
VPGAGVAELTRGPHSTDAAATRTEELFATLGLRTAWVADAPGLVLGRILAQLVNECAFALGEGVADRAEDIDAAMVLALNHPRGPLAWADLMGLEHVLTILDGLRAERGEERYRAAPLLRALVAEGRLGDLVGAGFHVSDEDGPHEPGGLAV